MRKLCEVIQIMFWVLMIIIFMFLINHGVISQASLRILTFEDKLSLCHSVNSDLDIPSEITNFSFWLL